MTYLRSEYHHFSARTSHLKLERQDHRLEEYEVAVEKEIQKKQRENQGMLVSHRATYSRLIFCPDLLSEVADLKRKIQELRQAFEEKSQALYETQAKYQELRDRKKLEEIMQADLNGSPLRPWTHACSDTRSSLSHRTHG